MRVDKASLIKYKGKEEVARETVLDTACELNWHTHPASILRMLFRQIILF